MAGKTKPDQATAVDKKPSGGKKMERRNNSLKPLLSTWLATWYWPWVFRSAYAFAYPQSYSGVPRRCLLRSSVRSASTLVTLQRLSVAEKVDADTYA